MEGHYYYRCSQCAQVYAADEIEKSFIYLCPRCGIAAKNAPLKGVLEVLYDYRTIREKIDKNAILDGPSGRPWRYPWLWPLTFEEKSGRLKAIDASLLENLALPSNQLLTLKWQGELLLIMDETRNPTFSFKDRASILVVLKALQMGIGEIAAASTGNAGSSLAGICARLGLQAQIWVPQAIPQAKLLQIQAYGAVIHKVAGDYDLAFDRSLEVSRQKHWYNRNTAYNPLTIEGKKSVAFDLFIQTRGKLPTTIFVPVGDGVIISGLYKGLNELRLLGWIEKLPRLMAVQAQGSDALVRYLRSGNFEFRPAHTVADSISAGAPRNLYMAARAVRATNGTALTVSDEEIFKAQRLLARSFGVLAEPAAAASFAGFLKWKNKAQQITDEVPMILITGNGLKDAQALKASLSQQ